MLLLVVDLLLRLGQVRLQLVVRVRRLGDALLQRRVGVGPGRPHVVGARRDQVVHVRPQPLRRGARSWRKQMFMVIDLKHISPLSLSVSRYVLIFLQAELTAGSHFHRMEGHDDWIKVNL